MVYQHIANHGLGIFWCGQIWPWVPLSGQTRIAKLKSAYNLLIIGPRGLDWYTNIYKIMGWESSGVVRFDLGPLLQGLTRIAKLKSAYNSLIIGPTGLGW